MSSIERLISSLKHSPQLPQAVAALQATLEAERQRRDQFYREMTPNQKIEFIDGDVVLHSPARNRHLDVAANIFALLRAHVLVNQIGEVKNEKCLCVFPRNDYEPDIVFFGQQKAAQFVHDTVKFPVPDLVVEVLSESTEVRDRGVKFEDFAANGVAEYWIVDADSQVVEQYLLADEGYVLHLKSDSGFLKSQVVLGFVVTIEALFDARLNLDAMRSILDR